MNCIICLFFHLIHIFTFLKLFYNVIKKAKEVENQVKIHGLDINNFKLVDDLNQLRDCTKLQGDLDKIAADEDKAALKINVCIIKVMLSGICPPPFNTTINNNVFKTVSDFIYWKYHRIWQWLQPWNQLCIGKADRALSGFNKIGMSSEISLEIKLQLLKVYELSALFLCNNGNMFFRRMLRTIWTELWRRPIHSALLHLNFAATIIFSMSSGSTG